MKIGANKNGNGTTSFTVWAPQRERVDLKLISPVDKLLPMQKGLWGYWHLDEVLVDGGAQYFYRLDDKIDRPDPASRFQPSGVHGPSQVIDHCVFKWNDTDYSAPVLEKYLIYELHVGTFSPEGTFEGVIEKLDYLRDLGITAIEIMPLSQFPGERNWGYDGAYPFAVQSSYGGPLDLKKLINECHKKGIAVIIDVVYNHFGPEGTYIQDFGPYFTKKYCTPWGDAINFDDAWSDGVRNYFVENAVSWFCDYHADALRLDAIHGIFDLGAKHILKEIAENVDKFSKDRGVKKYLIAESDLNDIRVISPFELNGYGIDAQWNDDFHHSIHVLLTGEDRSYYADYGMTEHLVKAFKDGFVYSWTYSQNRKHNHGSSSSNIPGKQLVICIQNHDQIGNRLLGERLSMLVPFEGLKVAAGALFTAPYIPLLFMGEEFASVSPFLYFISHSDKELIEAVRKGRAKEFAEFHWEGQTPDPESTEIFIKSKLDWDNSDSGDHGVMKKFYKTLMDIRKSFPALYKLEKKNLDVRYYKTNKLIRVERWHNESRVVAYFNFSEKSTEVQVDETDCKGKKLIDSSDIEWGGPGATMPLNIERLKEYRIPGYGFVLYKGDCE
jgi:maltooligosyltrehalose trehalohydrolase